MFRAVIIGLGGLIAGCAPARHVPKHAQPRPAPAMAPAHLLQHAHEGEELVLNTHLPTGARLHGAYLGDDDAEFVTDPAFVRCAKRTVAAITVDGERIYGSEPVDVSGAREIHVFAQRFDREVLVDLEVEGRRQCVPVRVLWPDAWQREEPWEVLLTLGADFNVAFDEEITGVGGVRLALFRWFELSRLGVEVGIVNNELCKEDPCEPGEGTFVMPAGFEADWFFYVERDDHASAFLGIGARAMAYAPLPEVEPPARLTFSPQAVVRLIGSFPPGGPSPLPAGLTFDHGVFFGPAVTADADEVALLFGFSLGIGWAE